MARLDSKLTYEEALDLYLKYDVTLLIVESLNRYASQRVPTGQFLQAVLSNDLFEAIGRADENNKHNLHNICKLIWNELGSDKWGSKEKVMEHLNG